MTTYFYTLTLDDSESIVLSDALTMYADSKQRNSDLAKKLLNRIHDDAVQGSGNNFNDNFLKEAPVSDFKTDLFDDLRWTPAPEQ